MGQNAVCYIVAVVFIITAVAAGPASYSCDDSLVQLSPKCNQSCFQSIGSALIDVYRVLSAGSKSLLWHGVAPGNECDACASSSSTQTLPAYCCWPGVYCCSEDPSSILDREGAPDACINDFPMGVHRLAMRGWNLSGSLTEEAVVGLVQLTLHGLHSVDLSANALIGSIPSSIGRLQGLQTLNLNLNRLEGTLPVEMADMEQLEQFYASFNNLTGSLEGRFCTKNDSILASLILRSNNLSGTINMTHCTGLQLLDVQDNRFHGSLPIGLTNQRLVSLRATNNLFNSNIPDAIWQLPLLATFDVANNDLTGTLSPYMGSANNLVNIRLGNNTLRGTIPENVTSNSQMLLLELYDNKGLHGTLPDVMNMVGIRVLDLRNTSISGTIPPVLGAFPYLEQVDIRMTRMLCCNTQSQADELAARDVDLLLPSFLQFNDDLKVFDITRNMQETVLAPDQPTDVMCGSVQRLPQPESEWNLLGLPVTNEAVRTQRWLISPLYSFFKNCTCTGAYVTEPDAQVPVNTTQEWCEDSRVPYSNTCVAMTMFRCAPPTPPTLTLKQQAAIGIAVSVCIAIMLVTANMCMARASKLRRYYMRAKTRLQGTPKHGRMSLVVTDIEGYSDIFRRTPEVMYRALVMHNRVMNTAKYANCGFVLEQEGDSFTLAFHDAFDAVAFCLQAQQALNSVHWPQGLDDEEPAYTSADSVGPSRKPSTLQQRLSRLLTSSTRRKFPARSAASSTLSEGDGSLGPSIHQSQSQQLSQTLGSRLAGLGSGLGGYKASVRGDSVLFAGLKVRMGVCTGDVPSGTPIKSSALFQTAKVVSDFGNGGQVIMDHVTFAAVKESLTVLGAVGAHGINYQRLATHRSLWTSLKVMLRCSSPLEPAEEAIVLDMGAYQHTTAGAAAADPEHQDLNCYPTVSTTQQESEMPAQQPDGCCRSWSAMLAQLRSERSAGHSSSASSAPGFPTSATAGHGQEDAAEAHGPASHQNTASAVRRVLSALRAGQLPGSITDSDSLPSVQSVQQSRGAPASFAAVRPSNSVSTAGGASIRESEPGQHSHVPFLGHMRSLKQSVMPAQQKDHKRRNWSCIRLFQILPPALTARAHVWANKLNVKEDWQCWDMPYFDAPGSKAVPLSGVGAIMQLTGSFSQGPAACCLCSNFTDAPSTPSATSAAGQAVVAPGLRSPSVLSNELDEAQVLSSSGPPAAVLSGLTPLLQPLHAVTMVFMTVENPEALVRRRRTFTPKVQALLNRVVRDALRHCGGYLSRVQEGELRFMVAFASALTALEWCLVVQEAAMYMAWPTEPVLLYDGCTLERDEQQQIVFRGPRLKMGVCEGVPSSIFPDHEGRADYHGAAVNMAARYTDKGAKGGQIACTLELAQKALAAWAVSNSSDGGVLQESSSLGTPAAAAPAYSTWCSPTTSVDEEAVLVEVEEQRLQRALQIPRAQQQQQQQQSSAAMLPARPPAVRTASSTQRNAWQMPWTKRPGVLASASPNPAPLGIDTVGSTAPAAAAATTVATSPLTSPTATGPNVVSGSFAAVGSDGVQLVPNRVTASLQQLQQQQQQQPDRSWPGSPPSNRVSTTGGATRPQSFILGSAAWQQQRQQQQLGQQPRLPPLQLSHQRVSSATGGPGEQQVASAFMAPHVARCPVQVEVHRLGLFSFKGGPVQQELVQIVPSHLIGRLSITERTALQSSRKGQLLHKLEGRVGEPTTVQLPTLAQKYKAALPERLLATPTRLPAATGRQGPRGGLAPGKSSASFILPPTSSAPADFEGAAGAAPATTSNHRRSREQQRVTWVSSGRRAAAAAVPARHSEGGATVTAAHPPPLSSLRVMSDITSQSTGMWKFAPAAMDSSSRHAGSGNRHMATTPAAAATDALVREASKHRANQTSSNAGCESSAPAAAADDPGTCSKASSVTVQDRFSIAQPTVDVNSTAAAAIATAECASSSPRVHSSSAAGSGLMRHDSFCSVVSGEGDTTMAADGAGDAAGTCRRSKPGSSGAAAPARVLHEGFSISAEQERD